MKTEAEIQHKGMQKKLYIGNMDAKRDWGHAKDYVDAMWRILQKDKPEDFVIAPGVTTKVRDFISLAFAEVGIILRFEGTDVDEKGIIDSIDQKKFETSTSQQLNKSTLATGQTLIEVDPRYFRPTEVEFLIGDPTKAKEKLGWEPKYNLQALLEDMMQADVKLFRKGQSLRKFNEIIW